MVALLLRVLCLVASSSCFQPREECGGLSLAGNGVGAWPHTCPGCMRLLVATALPAQAKSGSTPMRSPAWWSSTQAAGWAHSPGPWI